LISGEAPAVHIPPTESVAGGHESILVVDDEEDIVGIERLLLERLGYRVAPFVDSEQALREFRERPHAFDLLITDMAMPRLSGDELAREVLRIRPEMPIVLCTGFSDLIDAEKARSMGIREFLLKPLGSEVLAKVVRQALAGGHSAPPDTRKD